MVLSYRNKDRVAYATVNGQTGKVVADLPISVGKFLLGSLIAAIPVYILLCLLTVLTPGMTLTIVGVLAIIANICYSQELTMIAVKEAGTEDKGRIAKEQPEALGAINNRRRLKAAKKATKTIKKKTNTSFVAYFILFIFVIQFVPALFAIIAGIGSGFGNADGSLILFVILTIISFIFQSEPSQALTGCPDTRELQDSSLAWYPCLLAMLFFCSSRCSMHGTMAQLLSSSPQCLSH